MLRIGSVVAGALILLAVPSFAGDNNCDPNSGGGVSRWWHNFWTDFHRNNNWPEPFVCPDRASVANMCEAQTYKGWQVQNTLGEPHFETDNSRLTPTGVMKLRWIITQNPSQYRNVFVERGYTDDITAKRMATVQQAAAEIARGPMPEVMVTNIPLLSTPAEQVYGTNTWYSGYLQSMPKPTPEAFQKSDSSSGSGSGS